MDWKYLFNQKILDRGYGYDKCGDVYDLKFKNNVLTSKVSGTDEYDVEIYIDDGEIADMYCTCPYAQDGNECKHMAATLYEAEDHIRMFRDDYDEEYEDDYDEEYQDDDYYSKSLTYSFNADIENMVSLASSEEKDLFIKKILRKWYFFT